MSLAIRNRHPHFADTVFSDLPRLAAEDSVAAEIVKLKCFAGMGREEMASVLGITVHELRQEWTYAREWLRLALES